jgi:hypothetical protein
MSDIENLSPAEPTPSDPTPTSVLPAPATEPAAEPAAEPAQPTPTEGDWPADWRQKYAGEDPKLLKRLERYGSPKAALDALFAAQAKVAEKGTRLKEGATPEEVAAWRAENGIPESPDKYELSLPNGLVIGEADKEGVSEFLKQAHEANMSPAQVSQAVSWYLDKQEQALAAQSARDEETRMAAEDELRSEYGPEYRRNIRIANELLDEAPEGLKDKILASRGPDGVPLGNDPAMIRWLVGLRLELNPIATVSPGSGTNAVQSVENELQNLRSLMGDRQSEYWKGPKANQLQERYRALTSALHKETRRAA